VDGDPGEQGRQELKGLRLPEVPLGIGLQDSHRIGEVVLAGEAVVDLD
jgi:hypothetical protein